MKCFFACKYAILAHFAYLFDFQDVKLFTKRNAVFWRVKAMILQGKSLAFTIRKASFRDAIWQLLHHESLLFCEGKGRVLLFIALFSVKHGRFFCIFVLLM